MYNMVSLQFPRDMKVGLPSTALSRDDSLECTVLHTTIRFVVERSSSTWCHKAQYAGATTLSLLGLAVSTKPALHPQHVNPILASVRLVSCSHWHCLQCATDDLKPTQPPIT